MQSAAPRDAAVEAATYERCMKLARQSPGQARSLAQSWRERGGAHPADHCAAIALIGLKQYKEAAMRLEALAQAITSPAALRAEVLDQVTEGEPGIDQVFDQHDVAPYEAMKLRLLNASHSAFAYLGFLADILTPRVATIALAAQGLLAMLLTRRYWLAALRL